jgi:Cu/Ag efflux pump CusA
MRAAVLGSNPRVGRLAIALAIGVLIMGFTQLGSARVDFLPEFMPPTVQVQTEALGLSAAEVEQLVTVPLEQDLLNGVPWMERIHSRSQPGLSAIDIDFEPGTDIYAARQMIQERLTQAHALPAVGSPPIMVEPLASVGRVAMIGMKSTSVSPIDMSVLARWKVRPRLMGIPGVANVSIFGLRDRQLQVQVDPARLSSMGVTLTQVIETTGNALWVSPLTFVEASTPGTGGFIEGPNQRLAVQHVLPITTAKSLGQVTIEGTASPVRLGDVTQVIEDHQPLIGDAVETTPTLFLVIQKFPDADTVAVTKAVEEAMAGLQPGLEGIQVDTSVYRPASFIDSARHTIGLAGGLGLAAFVAAALLLFWSWRAALVIAAGVLTSTIATLYVLYLTGASLTTLTLAGLVAALVLVIGAMVGDVEAVLLGLGASRERRGEGRVTPREAVAETLGHTQASASIVFLACVLSMAPLLMLGPVATALIRPLVLSFALTLVSGVVVSLTVTPALMALVMRGAPPATPRLAGGAWLTARLAPMVARFASSRVLVGGAVAVLLVGGIAATIPQRGDAALVPTARDLNLLLQFDTPQGTSLTETNRVAALMSAELRRVTGVRAVGGHVGRAVTSDQLGDVNAGELWIDIAENADYPGTRSDIDRVAQQYPGVHIVVGTYSADRVAAARAGTGADLLVRVFGNDSAAPQHTAQQVAVSLNAVDNVRAPRVLAAAQQPTVRVEVDLAAAERHGLRPGDIRREATTLASGLTVGNLYEQAKVFDVVVLGTPATRASLSALQNIKVDTAAGSQVRLGDVAKVTVGPEPASIVHQQVMRSVDVVADVTGRDIAATLEDVRQAVAAVPMPAEAHLQVLSGALERQLAVQRAAVVALAVVIAMLLILQSALGSWSRAALLLLLAPLGGVGVVLTAPLVGGLATSGPLLGLFASTALTLLGAFGFARWPAALGSAHPASLGEAVATRTLPVVRTGLLVMAAFTPAVLLGDRAGAELLRPFALTLMGGAISSAFVVLCVAPMLTGLPKGADR